MKEYSIRKELTNRKDPVVLRLKKADGDNDFGSVEVYVRTSDKSDDFYLRYCLTYEKNNVGTTCKDKDGNVVPLTYYNGSNGGYNRSNYRIKTAAVCKKNGSDFEKLYDVLQQGEISMAFKEKLDGVMAGDFVGGFHGDENIKYEDGKPLVRLTLDGKDISTDGKEERDYVGDSVGFEQITYINRCNTPGVNIIEHSQKYTFDTDGVHVKQSAKFITDEYEKGRYSLDHFGSFMQMCTFWRVDSANTDKRICDDLKFFDENRRLVNEFNTSGYKSGEFGWAGADTETINRTVEYNGDRGVYGLVGYKILDDSVECSSSKIMIRTHGDNKWYCTFKSKNPNSQPKMGEEWKLELLYYIDYNSER